MPESDPESREATIVWAHDRVGMDQDERLTPGRPPPREGGPEPSVGRRQRRRPTRAVIDHQALSQHSALEDEVSTYTSNPARRNQEQAEADPHVATSRAEASRTGGYLHGSSREGVLAPYRLPGL